MVVGMNGWNNKPSRLRLGYEEMSKMWWTCSLWWPMLLATYRFMWGGRRMKWKNYRDFWKWCRINHPHILSWYLEEEEWSWQFVVIDIAGTAGQMIAVAEVGNLQVKCGVCGREYHVVLTPTWFVHQGRVPDVWICSEHRGSFVWSIAYTKVAICRCRVSKWCVLVMGLGIEDTWETPERRMVLKRLNIACMVKKSVARRTPIGLFLAMIERHLSASRSVNPFGSAQSSLLGQWFSQSNRLRSASRSVRPIGSAQSSLFGSKRCTTTDNVFRPSASVGLGRWDGVDLLRSIGSFLGDITSDCGWNYKQLISQRATWRPKGTTL